MSGERVGEGERTMSTPVEDLDVLFDEQRRLPDGLDALFKVAYPISAPFLWRRARGRMRRILLAGCLGAVPLLMQYLHSRVTVTAEEVRLALVPFWHKSIPRSEIAEVRPREIRAREMGGLGLRLTLDGAVALVMRGRQAVEIELTSGRRYVVGTDDPDGLLGVLSPSSPAS